MKEIFLVDFLMKISYDSKRREKEGASLKIIDRISLALLIIGGIHLLLIGLFGFNAVESLFGGIEEWGTRILYIVIGLSALWSIKYFGYTPKGGSRLRGRP